MRACLIVLGLIHFITGPIAFFAPEAFYEAIPGAKMMGPFNIHFIRDVGLTFIVRGGAMIYGALHWNQGVAVVGAAWPALHALFHIQIQISRGLPFDFIMAFDFFAVVLPAFAAMFLAYRLPDAA